MNMSVHYLFKLLASVLSYLTAEVLDHRTVLGFVCFLRAAIFSTAAFWSLAEQVCCSQWEYSSYFTSIDTGEITPHCSLGQKPLCASWLFCSFSRRQTTWERFVGRWKMWSIWKHPSPWGLGVAAIIFWSVAGGISHWAAEQSSPTRADGRKEGRMDGFTPGLNVSRWRRRN